MFENNSVDVIRASYPGTFSHGDTRRVLDGIGFKKRTDCFIYPYRVGERI